MCFPVKVTLYKNGHVLDTFIAGNEDDLVCPVEMDTGTGWLDAAGLYQTLRESGCDQVSETFRVCLSYEKWGSMQQEVVKIRARVARIA